MKHIVVHLQAEKYAIRTSFTLPEEMDLSHPDLEFSAVNLDKLYDDLFFTETSRLTKERLNFV